ncbi:HAD-IA family hydrolase, partial [Bacillus sp. SIMBA_008]|uniref:HAD-IA family hydrolase n=1 Tax=Bacillus sp. SIMBA_008 TaxID=3085757 RepID=UPI00397C1086
HAVGLITDNKADRMATLSALHDLPATFDPIVVSAEVGSGKDGPAIFQHALARLGVAPVECLFIDNTAANLRAAAALGMAT